METARDIEKLFMSEVRDKKRVGVNAFKMRGKGKKHGMHMRSEYDFLTAKQRKRLNSDIEVTNVYKSLMKLEELKSYAKDMQIRIIKEWRKFHKNKEIIQALGTNRQTYYDLLHDLGIIERPADIVDRQANPRSSTKPNPKPEDLITFEELESKSDEEKLAILDEYLENYNFHKVAEIWEKKTQYLYNLRYKLKKKFTKEEARKILSKPKRLIPEKPKQKAIAIAQAPVKEEPMEDLFTYPEETKASDPKPWTSQVEKESNLEETIQAILSKLLPQPEPPKPEPITQAPPVETPTLDQVSPSGFTMQYENEKEAFLIHQDIKRLISTLEKNPDIFRVKITMERVENE